MEAALKKEQIQLGPQPGPQTAFLACTADIAIYGGSAGSGKSYGLILDPLRHWQNGEFGGVVFRKNATQVRIKGGLWDESGKVYSLFRARPRQDSMQWTFPSGMTMKFAHLEHASSVYDHQGGQYPYIGWDELTHFSEHQFFYLLSRNRSMSGVPGYVRGTCNPDPDSWVRTFIDWWIGEDGYSIPERSGQLRWFIRQDDKIVWADSVEELFAKYGTGPEIQPKSVTFIPAKLQDNQILMKKDPSYLANLLAQNRVDRLRLLGGNWNVRATAGMLFQREWFPVVEAIPGGFSQAVRFWDRAATKPNENNKDPDWTRGLLLLKYPNGRFCVADLKSMRDTPSKVEDLIRNVASQDSTSVRIKSQQDPGSAGVMEGEYFVRMLAGYDVSTETMPKDKVTRAKPVSAQCEVGNVMVKRAPWNEEFFSELENFPPPEDGVGHDDIVDTLSGAFNDLCEGRSLADIL